MTDRHRDVHTFVADLPTWDDDTLLAAAVLLGGITRRGPHAETVQAGMRAEVERRGMAAQVAALIEAAKDRAKQELAHSITTYMPDGSTVLSMPGATVTMREVRENRS